MVFDQYNRADLKMIVIVMKIEKPDNKKNGGTSTKTNILFS